MNWDSAYPKFVGRKQEIEALTKFAKLRHTANCVVLLDGIGGIGKTWLVHALAERLASGPEVLCAKPIDMDDTSFHLPSYFSQTLADHLGKKAFSRYLHDIAFYQEQGRRKIDLTTIHDHLRRCESIFIQEYNQVARQKRVAIFLDTFEAVQDHPDFGYFFQRLITEFENTTFFVAGRRVKELKGKLKNLKVKMEVVQLEGLAVSEIDDFYAGLADLQDEQKRKLALLTKSNPLLLCLALDCYRYGYWLDDIDRYSFEQMQKLFQRNPQQARVLQYKFEQSLVIAYADMIPFRYFIRQLTHASRRVNREIFNAIISFPEKGDQQEWWERLRTLPYIRKRAAQDYVSVHDVLRDLILTHVMPARDPDHVESATLSKKLIACYESILLREGAELKQCAAQFEQEAREQGGFIEEKKPVGKLAELATQITTIESRIWIFEAELLHYQFLSDPNRASELFIRQFDQATSSRQIALRQRLVNEVWLLFKEGAITSEIKAHLALSRRLIKQRADDGYAEDAITHVSELLKLYKEPSQRISLLDLRADCKLLLPQGIAQAIADYKRALDIASKAELPALESAYLEKQIGWCYRQIGDWDKAGEWYTRALESLQRSRVPDAGIRKELASLYTNAAYVQAFRGDFTRAMDFGLRGLRYRKKLGLKLEQGMSHSTLGEIHRYHREYPKALSCYAQAEEIFQQSDDRAWLGRIWQQEAVCLLQMGGDLVKALNKAKQAIEYCSQYNVLALPSAYNRAGRIVAVLLEHSAEERLNLSLYYFRAGLTKALEVGDSWFGLANCVEALEVILREYESSSDSKLLKLFKEMHERIIDVVGKDQRATQRKSGIFFPDLLGRHQIALGTREYLAGFPQDAKMLEKALQYYLEGFQMITRGFFGSYGHARMTEELDRLTDRILELPHATALRWRNRFVKEWKGKRRDDALRHFADRIDDLLNVEGNSSETEALQKVA